MYHLYNLPKILHYLLLFLYIQFLNVGRIGTEIHCITTCSNGCCFENIKFGIMHINRIGYPTTHQYSIGQIKSFSCRYNQIFVFMGSITAF